MARNTSAFLDIETTHEHSSSFLDMETTQEEIYRIRDLDKKFCHSCRQLVVLDNLIEETGIRYNHSKAEQHAENKSEK